MIITGVGTGGHITGVAEELKKHWPKLKVFAVEPAASPVIAGGQPGPHPIQGIGAGFIPANLHTKALDGVIEVDAAVAKDMARRSAAEEGMLVGISSGATLAAILQKLPDLPAGVRVLGFNYDTGERLSLRPGLPTGSLMPHHHGRTVLRAILIAIAALAIAMPLWVVTHPPVIRHAPKLLVAQKRVVPAGRTAAR